MNKVVKVSIGNIAFTLEEEAFAILNNYLTSLKNHYQDNSNGDEIIDGIEERIAELLIEKCGQDGIVPPSAAREVIAILGNPEIIDNECGENHHSSPNNSGKKLFRSPYNKILGGVCAGMGEYFERDAILFRILFVLSGVLLAFGSWGFGLLAICITYLILWIVVPEAKTVEQRCRMRGEGNTIDSIEKNIEKGAKQVSDGIKRVRDENPDFWQKVGVVFEKVFGFIFSLIGLTLLIVLVMGLFGMKMWDLAMPFMGIDIFSSLFNGNPQMVSVWIKILLSAIIFIPILGFLFSGIQMLFGFKSPRWRPGLILFLIWIASLITLFCIGASSSVKYWNTETKSVSERIELQSDTLFVEFNDVDRWENEKVYVEADRKEYDLVFFKYDEISDPQIIMYPKIKVYKDYKEETEIISETDLFTGKLSLSEIREYSQTPLYTFDGNVLRVDPVIYGGGNEVKDIKRCIKLYVGEDVVVIIKDPIYHQFKNHFEYSNIEWLKIVEKWD